MRFLHVADLHLGKNLLELPLYDEQAKMLETLTDMAVANKADAVLIAGDIYQRSAPQAEAMEMLSAFLSGLAGRGIRLFMISGNHDHAQRISDLAGLVRQSGVYISESFDGKTQKISLSDEYGEIDIHLLPFVRVSAVKLKYPGEKISTCTEAVQCVLTHSDIDYSKRNVLISHQFITGGELSGSEEKTIGTLESVDAEILSGFDYVALGHLHKPQKVFRDTIRYAGSPLKYSFSEENDIKSAVLVGIGKKGDTKVQLLPIPQPKEVRRIEGSISEIMLMPYSEDLVWVSVTDEDVPPDTRRMITTVFPNMLRFTINNSKTNQTLDVTNTENVEDLDAESLFKDFYALQNNSVQPGEKQLALFRNLFTWEEAK